MYLRHKKIEGMIFDKTTHIADVVLQHPFLLTVTERFDISLGFKDKTVEEVCKENNINTDVFLLIADLYQNTDDEQVIDLCDQDIEQILKYLKKSHEYYTQEVLPEISNQIKLLTNDSEDLSLVMVEKFFEQYISEVKAHLSYEEKNVYPYALRLIKEGTRVADYSIMEYKNNHDDIETKLDDLKNLLIRHLPGDSNRKHRRNILLDLFRFEQDLYIHTIIEERVLIPYIDKVESLSQNKEA